MASVIVTLKSSKITISDIETSAKRANLNLRILSPKILDVYSQNENTISAWNKQYATNPNVKTEIIKHKLSHDAKLLRRPNICAASLDPNEKNRPWFTMKEIASIYNIPAPLPDTNVVVGVVSFGGGLYGTVDSNGVLTNGDVQAYWTLIGIPESQHPRVIIKTIDGASNRPSVNDEGATMENTLDVETIGGVCPSPNLTIILYIAPNTLSEFYNMFSYIYKTDITVNDVTYKPSIISCSWGAPEIYYGMPLLEKINTILSTLTAAGINICAATGDNGSNDGVGGSGSYTDFPSSSPNVIAVGGTTLVCPNKVYDSETRESAWSSGGGGISSKFPKPSYQSTITAKGRSVPDIAAVANPNTGVMFLINAAREIIGGTSVASPIIAGYLAAINYRTFLNPILYTVPSNSFNDIITGSNGAFSAKPGYDNCTGLGTINGANLTTAIVKDSTSPPDESNIKKIGAVTVFVPHGFFLGNGFFLTQTNVTLSFQLHCPAFFLG